jgi:hypothetical protein
MRAVPPSGLSIVVVPNDPGAPSLPSVVSAPGA